MKPFALSLRCILLTWVLLSGLLSNNAFAQPLQREWVKNYFNVQTMVNQPAGVLPYQSDNPAIAGRAIAVDANGDVIVGGTSQNVEGDFDYEIIKYKPNGDEAWRFRYATANQGDDQLRDMALDPSGNVIITGTSDTVKISPLGSLIWHVPVAARALITTQSYVYLAGLTPVDFLTVQLENNNLDGHELWRQVLDGRAHGSDVAMAITLDPDGNVYVAGQEEYDPCTSGSCWRLFAVVSYSPTGAQRWFADATTKRFPASAATANSIVVGANGIVYVYGTYDGLNATFAEFSPSGPVGLWDYRDAGAADTGTKMIGERAHGDLLCTGSDYSDKAFLNKFQKEDPSKETNLWTYSGPTGRTRGMDLAQDSVGNVYVTGYSRNDASSRAMFVAKVTMAGQQLGVDRYNSPNAASNYGTALAIDSHDNVYVTGYVMNTLGGSELVTIKYSATPKIEKKPSGAMHLEFHTSPGQQYSIEGTSDFFNWQSLITNTADLNGIIQFDDTNTSTIPFRFYRGKQP